MIDIEKLEIIANNHPDVESQVTCIKDLRKASKERLGEAITSAVLGGIFTTGFLLLHSLIEKDVSAVMGATIMGLPACFLWGAFVYHLWDGIRLNKISKKKEEYVLSLYKE